MRDESHDADEQERLDDDDLGDATGGAEQGTDRGPLDPSAGVNPFL